jgi:hypothetical protein
MTPKKDKSKYKASFESDLFKLTFPNGIDHYLDGIKFEDEEEVDSPELSPVHTQIQTPA